MKNKKRLKRTDGAWSSGCNDLIAGNVLRFAGHENASSCFMLKNATPRKYGKSHLADGESFCENGRLIGCVGIACRAYGRKSLNPATLQAQKMAAVGRFACGIAHDFNNILTAIIGYQALLQPRLKDDDKACYYADQVSTLSQKATNLTQHLLSFVRKDPVSPTPVNLNEVVTNIVNFLKSLIGNNIELSTELCDEFLPVLAVTSQIEQILMNLVTNARDAMSQGGSLVVKTGITRAACMNDRKHSQVYSGTYAYFTITDTGHGMDEKTKSRLFEPNFTTKEGAKGVGLGLATVFGVVQQHNGRIHVYSRPGEGSTFRICLPLVKDEDNYSAHSGNAGKIPPPLAGGG